MGSLGATLATTGNTTDAVASGVSSSVAVEDNRLFLRGNDGQKEQLLAILQELSDKKLVVDGRGEVLVDKEYLDKIFSSLDPNSDKYIDTLLELRVLLAEEHPIGTKLVDKLIEDRRIVNIQIQDGVNRGTKTNIFLDPSMNIQAWAVDENGKSEKEPIPDYIVLGHEMIHTLDLFYDSPTNNTFDSNTYSYTYERNGQNYTVPIYQDLRGNDQTKGAELRAIGIPGFIGEDGFSENALRIEHNLNTRTSYGSYEPATESTKK